MLVGNWTINLFFGLTAFIIVFISSFGQNLIITTSIRAGIAFILSFVIGYIFRYLFTVASKERSDLIGMETEVLESENSDIPDPNLLENKEMDLSEEDIYKASQYVKDLLDDEEV